MADDFNISDEALAGTREGSQDEPERSRGTPTFGGDGTTLTGESETSADTTDRDLAEPAAE